VYEKHTRTERTNKLYLEHVWWTTHSGQTNRQQTDQPNNRGWTNCSKMMNQSRKIYPLQNISFWCHIICQFV
jgi:hypothetical protein